MKNLKFNKTNQDQANTIALVVLVFLNLQKLSKCTKVPKSIKGCCTECNKNPTRINKRTRRANDNLFLREFQSKNPYFKSYYKIQYKHKQVCYQQSARVIKVVLIQFQCQSLTILNEGQIYEALIALGMMPSYMHSQASAFFSISVCQTITNWRRTLIWQITAYSQQVEIIQYSHIRCEVSMSLDKKIAQAFRSSKDQSLYLLYALFNNLQMLPQFIPYVAINEYVKAGCNLGCIIEEGQQKYNIQAPFTGTILQIKIVQRSGIKNKMIHLFSMCPCQHFPKPKNQGQLLDSQYSQNKSILHTADICTFCEEPIWFYYQKQQNEISLGQIKKGFENFDLHEFQWKVVMNEPFTKDTQIGGTYQQSYTINESGKITYLLNFDELNNKHCSFDKIVLKYKKVVCKHERVSGGLCVFCLTDVRNLKNVNFRRYLFQFDQQNFNPNILLSGNALEDQAEQFKKKLIKQKKGLLILDLDSTILHSISSKRVSDQMAKQFDEYSLIPLEQTPSIFIEKTLVKFRPNFQFFLSVVIDFYEIFIYTKGTRLYAQQICKAIKKNYGSVLKQTKNFLPHRIISRDEDPNLGKKNLDYIIPKNRDIMLILDDRRDVWNFSSLCVFTRPYIFFYCVSVTKDGKTKLQPVEWQKGGGTLQHKLNEQQKKCLKQILKAEQCGLNEVVEMKLAQLQEQIIKCDNNEQKVCELGHQHNPKLTQNIKIQQNKEISKQQNNSVALYKQAVVSLSQKKIDANHDVDKELKHNGKVPDDYLITTAFALKQAHNIYFSKLQLAPDQQRKQGRYSDLSFSFHEYKKTILDHLSVYFIIKDYKKTNVYRRAQKLGLKIIENQHQKIDIIIRPNNFLADFAQSSVEQSNKYYSETVRKLKSIAQVRKIPIVSETWIDVCYQFNCCLQYNYFVPSNPYSKSILSTQKQVCDIVTQATTQASQNIRIILKGGTTDEKQ